MVKMLQPRLQVVGSKIPRSQSASWRAPDASPTERGYDHKWRKARGQYLRLHPFCVMCEQMDGLIRAADVVDHKIPHRGDMKLFWDRTNWQSLCKPHHDGHKQRIERGLEPGVP